jgi:hypothetical protein
MTIKLQSLMVLCIAQVKNWCYLVRLEALICQISCPKLTVIELLHRRHFPLGGHVTTATRETTSNAGILLRCWVMFNVRLSEVYPGYCFSDEIDPVGNVCIPRTTFTLSAILTIILFSAS